MSSNTKLTKLLLILLLQLTMLHQMKSMSLLMREASLRSGSSLLLLTQGHRQLSKKISVLSSLKNHKGSNNDDRSDTNSEHDNRRRDQQQQQQQQQQLERNYKISLPDNLYRPFFPIYYNDVYEVPLPPRHRFPMSKYRQVRERVQDGIATLTSKDGSDGSGYTAADTATTVTTTVTTAPAAVQLNFIVSPLVTKEDLITTHCEKYVERYLIGDQTELELRNVGFPWSPEGVNRSLSSTGGTVAAALAVCNARKEQLNVSLGGADIQVPAATLTSDADGDDATDFVASAGTATATTNARFGPLFAAHVAGGTHHAFRDRGEGFSVFSDIAVAANVVLRDFPEIVSRILIIDLDVHQGNGNAVLFQNDDRVFTFSMHCKGNYFSAKEDSDLDIELPIGCNDETYLGTLNHWLKRIRNEAGQFDLIFFQAGVDIIESDRLGRMNITHKGICRRNRMVYKFALDTGIPIVITMGGGYPRKDWEPILRAHTDVYMNAFESIRSFNDQNR
mmetsp:Transcript_7319/g.11138  ORF Transcript_7319/g.11138 Transcript_7319/m.11138 type:complete len:505 (-) Transcript_7319:1899-3413(-)